MTFKQEQAVYVLISIYNKLAVEIDPFNVGNIEVVEMTIRLYNHFKENYQKTIDEIREEISVYMTFEVDDPYQQPLCDLSNDLFEQLAYMEDL